MEAYIEGFLKYFLDQKREHVIVLSTRCGDQTDIAPLLLQGLFQLRGALITPEFVPGRGFSINANSDSQERLNFIGLNEISLHDPTRMNKPKDIAEPIREALESINGKKVLLVVSETEVSIKSHGFGKRH